MRQTVQLLALQDALIKAAGIWDTTKQKAQEGWDATKRKTKELFADDPLDKEYSINPPANIGELAANRHLKRIVDAEKKEPGAADKVNALHQYMATHWPEHGLSEAPFVMRRPADEQIAYWKNTTPENRAYMAAMDPSWMLYEQGIYDRNKGDSFAAYPEYNAINTGTKTPAGNLGNLVSHFTKHVPKFLTVDPATAYGPTAHEYGHLEDFAKRRYLVGLPQPKADPTIGDELNREELFDPENNPSVEEVSNNQVPIADKALFPKKFSKNNFLRGSDADMFAAYATDLGYKYLAEREASRKGGNILSKATGMPRQEANTHTYAGLGTYQNFINTIRTNKILRNAYPFHDVLYREGFEDEPAMKLQDSLNREIRDAYNERRRKWTDTRSRVSDLLDRILTTA